MAFNQPINQIGVHLSQVLKTGQPDETGQTRQYIEIAQYLEQSFHQICNEDRPGKKIELRGRTHAMRRCSQPLISIMSIKISRHHANSNDKFNVC